jgi:hypothetical protein
MSKHDYHPTDEDIRPYAYILWQRHGSPIGQDLRFWFLGRQNVIARHRLAEKEKRVTG